MQGYFSLILHAHLPFVRHPEHDRFLEESWLFEAITECYLPLLQILEGWSRDRVNAQLTLSLSPTLCAMLLDPLLQSRYQRHLESLVALADREIHRTLWDASLQPLARMYHERFQSSLNYWNASGRNLIGRFRKFQENQNLEIITCAATHAVLPLLANHPPSLRAQILVARDCYRTCFGCDPRGFWLPECAYSPEIEPFLQEAGIRWFILDSHGLLHANPRPRFGTFAPIFTPNGLAAFGRDFDSARQVWSKNEGYPGDPNYRDFYRDIGFDLDLDYVRPFLPASDHRGFTGIKYHRITGNQKDKQPYQRNLALDTAGVHAGHFLDQRCEQVRRLAEVMGRPPLLIAPYDAELFGHWWYEGPEFLDYFVRKTVFDQHDLHLITPQEYLTRHPTQQISQPSPSSWGAEGYWNVWLNESNEWILPHLQVAQERMTSLARQFRNPNALQARALRQAGRELLLAQSSDWPFILRTGTSPDYARQRFQQHVARFNTLFDQLTSATINESWLAHVESLDNLFPQLDFTRCR